MSWKESNITGPADFAGKKVTLHFSNKKLEPIQAMAVMTELQRLARLAPDWSWAKVAVIGREWTLCHPASGWRSLCAMICPLLMTFGSATPLSMKGVGFHAVVQGTGPAAHTHVVVAWEALTHRRLFRGASEVERDPLQAELDARRIRPRILLAADVLVYDGGDDDEERPKMMDETRQVFAAHGVEELAVPRI